MSSGSDATLERWKSQEYKYGFYTDIETDSAPPGLNEDIVRLISAKKNEPQWLLDWRLKSYRHWLTMVEPTWPNVHYPPIDYQSIVYYSAPKQATDGPKSLDDVDPKLLETYEKLGIPLHEREVLAGVAVDAVFDSVSVATTFKDKLSKLGIIFCPFSEAVQEHPHRTVALKVLRQGMAAPSMARRFRHEAEILGRLRHPNIAQVYEAGTLDEGEGAQPWFAMELITGKPLIEHSNSTEQVGHQQSIDDESGPVPGYNDDLPEPLAERLYLPHHRILD